MRRALLMACLGVASACGFLGVTAAVASASTTPTMVSLPAVAAADNIPFAMTATVEPLAPHMDPP